MTVRILNGDALATLQALPEQSAQTCVTSPPYFGLRDYGHAGQMGLESTPDAYVAAMVAVFAEVRRVLKDDGTLWLNIGDSYAGSGRGAWDVPDAVLTASGMKEVYRPNKKPVGTTAKLQATTRGAGDDRCYGMKPKDLMGIPWLLAFALRADGWYLRSDIIWHKPNPMPESVTDRPTKSHEYLFLLSKSERYYYDAAAIKEPVAPSQVGRVRADAIGGTSHKERGQHSPGGVYRSGNTERKPASARGVPVDTDGRSAGAVAGSVPWEDDGTGRNKRTVWTVATTPFRGAHFATFPPALIEPCILAGSKHGDTVLDPFGGAGTTALVADRLGRDALLIELNPTYAAMAWERVHSDNPLGVGYAV